MDSTKWLVVHYHEHSKLDYGIGIRDGDLAVVDEDGLYPTANFKAGATYFYKMSVLYDSYQESPLTSFYFTYVPVLDSITAILTVILENPAPRATHIVVYRKNSIGDFYRMVKEIDLSNGWGLTGTSYFTVIVDNGILGATYETISGMPESLRETNVNYKLSIAAAGYLFTGSCYHPEIKNGQNFLFRSQPGNFSVFNW